MATIKNQPPKRTLTYQERESINDTIATKKELLKATDNYTEGNYTVVAPAETGLNKEKLKADIRSLEHTLQSQSPQEASARERDKLDSRRRELEDFLREKVLETRAEIAVTNNQHPDWITATKKAQVRPKYESMIAEYREICKRLEPNDPYAGSLDAIRKDR